MTILLADDEKSICEYLRTLVNWSAYGYTFLTVENGQAALDMIHTISVDLLLLDVTMPVMNGLEVLEQLSAEKSKCIVTLLTCHDEFEYVQKALRYNCFDYVLKSAIDSNNILELIERMHTQLSEDTREHHAYEKLSIAKRQQEEQATQQIVCDWLRTNYAPRGGILSHMEHHLDFQNVNTRYVLLCVVLTNYLEAISRYTDGNTAQFSNVIDGVLRELLEQHHFFYVQAENDSFLIFLCYDYRSNLQTVMASTQSLADQI
ncbi:MAG: response regulator, partial [Ruthenibacterium sp.]